MVVRAMHAVRAAHRTRLEEFEGSVSMVCGRNYGWRGQLQTAAGGPMSHPMGQPSRLVAPNDLYCLTPCIV